MAKAKSTGLGRMPMLAKIGIAIGLLGLTALAYWTVFYADISGRIKSAEAAEKGLQKNLAEARKLEVKYQADLKELNDRELRQRELEKVLPTKTEHPAFLSSLQTVANMTGVTLSAWAPQGEVREKYYARIPMKLTLEGRFHQIAKFFYGVGQVDRIINVENITIDDPQVRDEDVHVKVDALATAFRAVEPEPEQPKESRNRNSRGKKAEK
ncbi:MAG TPA: type 4a pilus biogenesis protein PilO [Polyangiaceae bacterium]